MDYQAIIDHAKATGALKQADLITVILAMAEKLEKLEAKRKGA